MQTFHSIGTTTDRVVIFTRRVFSRLLNSEKQFTG